MSLFLSRPLVALWFEDKTDTAVNTQGNMGCGPELIKSSEQYMNNYFPD